MSNINHTLYTFEDKTSDEVLLINGFQHINQLIPYVNKIQQERDKYKEVIDKLREALSYIDNDIMETCENYDVNGIELKRILDEAINYKPISLKEFDEYVAKDNEDLWKD